MAQRPEDELNQYNTNPNAGDTSQPAIEGIGQGIGQHPVNKPDNFNFTQEGRKDGKVIDWSKVPMGGFTVGGNQMSVDEGMRSGMIQDPRYHFFRRTV